MLAQSLSSGRPVGQVRDRLTAQVETASPDEDLLGIVRRGELLRALEALQNKAGDTRSSSPYERIDERHRRFD